MCFGIIQAQLIEAVDISEIITYDGISGPWIMDDAGNKVATKQGPSWADYQFFTWNTSDFAGWQDGNTPSGYGGYVSGGSVADIKDIAVNGTTAGRFTWPEYIFDADGDTIPDTLFNAQIAAVADANSWGKWIPLGVLDDTLKYGSTNFGTANVISADGRIVAGAMPTLDKGDIPFVYNLDSLTLDTLPRLDYGSNSTITAISGDGSVLIGASYEGWTAYPFKWTLNSEGSYDTTRIDSPIVDMNYAVISVNGKHYSGAGAYTMSGQPYHLVTEINGVDTTIQLPAIPGILGSSRALYVANDGTVFGYCQEAGGPWGGPNHAYMYHHEGGAIDLEYALTALGLEAPPAQTGPMRMAQVIAADSSGKKLLISYDNDYYQYAYMWVVLPDVSPPVHLDIEYTDDIQIIPAGIDLEWENVMPYNYTFKVESAYQPYGDEWGSWTELVTGLAEDEYHHDITVGGYYKWRVFAQYDGAESIATESEVFEIRRFLDEPTMTSVSDVPEDQGGKVIVEFVASGFDILGGMTNELYTVQTYIGDTWVAVATTAAYGDDAYAVQVNTVNNSVDDGTTNSQDFRVVAALGQDVFISAVMSGYSVDNIAPPAPTNLAGEIISGPSVQLTWSPVNINDLGYYKVYRGSDASLSDGVLVGQTNSTDFTDSEVTAGTTYYYAVAGMDIHNNVGESSSTISLEVLGINDNDNLPEEFALSQNYPNPFNPSTTINFALPQAEKVVLVIYDLTGREVTKLVNSNLEAGNHSAVWNGLNSQGLRVSSGIYLYKLTAGEFTDMKTLTYLR